MENFASLEYQRMQHLLEIAIYKFWLIYGVELVLVKVRLKTTYYAYMIQNMRISKNSKSNWHQQVCTHNIHYSTHGTVNVNKFKKLWVQLFLKHLDNHTPTD